MTDRPPVANWSLFAVVVHGVISLAWVIVVAIGLRTLVTGSPVVGVALVALGSVTLGFSVRRSVRKLRQGPDPTADLPREEFDYLVWTSFAVPMLLAGLLVLLLITGGLGSR